MTRSDTRFGAPVIPPSLVISLLHGNEAIICYSQSRYKGNFIRLPVSNLQFNVKQLLATNKVKYSEEELVLALKRNERTAFEFLYDHYSGALFNIISKTLKG
jgi:hypothetical protein